MEIEMHTDIELLQKYASEGLELAFGEIVSRYLGLVYSTALRQVNGDSHLAEDITQSVFSDLALKAGKLPRNVILGGWLHRATIFAASQHRRADRRRKEREQHAVAMNALHSNEETDWDSVSPVLDGLLNQLGEL